MDSKEVQSESTSVIKTIFKFDDETKTTLMNLIQYAMVAFIPLVALQMGSEKIFPAHYDERGNVELVMEILGQSIFIILGIFLIHRIVMVVPTFSGVALGEVNLFSIVLVFMLCAIMFPGNIQMKSATLSNRLMDAWEGKTEDKKNTNKNKKQPIVSVTQPISGPIPPQHQPSRADHMNQQQPPIVPPNNSTLQPPNMHTEQFAPQMPAEPMAFNEMGGGSFASF